MTLLEPLVLVVLVHLVQNYNYSIGQNCITGAMLWDVRIQLPSAVKNTMKLNKS